jgi:hypothetical protein
LSKIDARVPLAGSTLFGAIGRVDRQLFGSVDYLAHPTLDEQHIVAGCARGHAAARSSFGHMARMADRSRQRL